MSELFFDFCAFCQAVFSHWVEFLCGGIVAFGWLIYCQVTGKAIPMKAFYVILAVCFVCALFGAWRDQRKELQRSEAQRPYFQLSDPGIRPLPNQETYRFIIPTENTGINPASELVIKIALQDQKFATEPQIVEMSVANDIPHGSPSPYYNDTIALRREMAPTFIIYGLQYKDALTRKLYTQIFYMKWGGVVGGETAPNFVHVNAEEKREIESHVKPLFPQPK